MRKYQKPRLELTELNLRDGIMTMTSIAVKKDEEIDDSGKILAPERRQRTDAWNEW